MKKILTMCCVLCASLLYAQKAREYVVLKNDTIFGEVIIISANKRISSIEFSNGALAPVKYTPNDVLGFFDQEYGLHETMLIDGDWMYTRSDRSADKRTMEFLEVLTTGELRLLSYKEGALFFIQYKQKDVEPLLIVRNIVYVDYNNKVVPVSSINTKEKILYTEKFKGVLTSYMAPQCSEIKSAINRAELKEKSLVALFNKYYKCIHKEDGQVIDKAENKRGKIYYGIQAGYAFTKIHIFVNGEGTSSLLTAKFNNSNALIPGLFLDYFVSNRNQKLSLLVELQYQNINSTAPWYTYFAVPGADVTYSMDIDYLKLNTSLKYRFKENKFTPVLLAGLVNDFKINGSFTRAIGFAGNPLNEMDISDELRSWMFGGLVGGGLEYERFSLSCRYEMVFGFIPNTTSYKTSFNTVYVMASFRLNK